MRLVILESPFAGDVDANLIYAKKCVHDCLLRGEAPIASHLLFTQPGVLDDNHPEQRKLGIAAGHAWYRVAEAAVVYTDRGISGGMAEGIRIASSLNIPIEYRSIGAAQAQPVSAPVAGEAKFKVGQRWIDGLGRVIEILEIAQNVHDHHWLKGKVLAYEDSTPAEGNYLTTYEPDGRHFPLDRTSPLDLVTLIPDRQNHG